MTELLLVFKWRIVTYSIFNNLSSFKMKTLTKKRNNLMEEAGEEHPAGKATKVKGCRRLEKANRHVSTKNGLI